MHKLKLLPILVLLLSITFVSCDKDEDAPPAPTRTDLLTAGTWNGFAILINGQDFTQEVKDEFDITLYSYRFNKDGNFTESYDGDSDGGKWVFANNEQEVILNPGTDQFPMKIKKLDNQELYFEYTVEIEGQTLTVEERFKLRQ